MSSPTSDIPSPMASPKSSTSPMSGSTSPSRSPATSPFTSPSRSPNLKPTSPPKSSSPTTTTTPMPLIVQHTPPDLRHVTSIGGIADAKRESHAGSRRVSAHLQTGGRVGSKSPSSIPSSPTSVHSSSSAIFERDIEPLVSISPLIHPHHPSHSPSSPHQHQPSVATITPHSNPTSSSSVGSTHTHVSTVNPHRIPRAQMTAAIEQSVPSVLDSAAELLTSLQDTSGPEGDRIEVEAPVPFGNRSPFSMSGYSSPSSAVTGLGGFSPIGRGRGSRSPSPGPSAGVNTNKMGGSLLLSGGSSTSGSKPAPKISTSTLTSPTGTTSTSSSPNTALPQSTTSQGHGFAHAPPLERINSVSTSSPMTPQTDSMVSATPTSAYFSIASESGNSRQTSRAATPDVEDITMDFSQQRPAAESVATAATSIPESPVATATISPSAPAAISPSPRPQPQSPPHPQAHPQLRQTSISSTASGSASTKRLSFLSYTDLLSSTPTSTLPLSSLTGAKGYSGEEPPHLLLNSLDAINHSAGSSSAGGSPPYSPLISPLVLGAPGTGAGVGGASPSKSPAMGAGASPGPASRAPSMRSGNRDRDSLIMLEDLVGGEWEREGLGRGLEERLERIERMEAQQQQQQVGVLGVGRA